MLFETIAKLIAERTDCKAEDVTMESTFAEPGIDSLDTVELLMNLEDEIGMEIEPEQKVVTIGDLVAFIESKQGWMPTPGRCAAWNAVLRIARRYTRRPHHDGFSIDPEANLNNGVTTKLAAEYLARGVQTNG